MQECTFKNLLLILGGFWLLVYLIDALLHRFHPKLHQRLQRAGFEAGLGQLRIAGDEPARWWDERFRPFLLGHRQCCQAWFSLGVVAALAAMVFTLLLLTRMLYGQLVMTYDVISGAPPETSSMPHPSTPEASASGQATPSFKHDGSGPRLIAIIPGLTTPIAHAPVFFLVLIVATVYHELGHVAAGLLEGASLTGFGVFVYVIYPGAFTNFDTASLDLLSPMRRLKVFAAGIWHNFILAIVALLFWLLATTYISPWAYKEIQGVHIIANHLPDLTGENGLKQGSRVTGINACPVSNPEDWKQCLSALASRDSHQGNCISRKHFLATSHYEAKSVNGEIECCPRTEAAASLCFYAAGTDRGTFSCLSARQATSQPHCGNVSSEYSSLAAERTPFSQDTLNIGGKYAKFTVTACPSGQVCAFPALFNDTRLMRFRVVATPRNVNATDVLFIGDPVDILRNVDVTSRVPRNEFVAVVADAGSLIVQYTVSLSLALALLNAVPCYGLDGYHIVMCIASSVGKPHKVKAQRLAGWTVVIGTVLLITQTGYAVLALGSSFV